MAAACRFARPSARSVLGEKGHWHELTWKISKASLPASGAFTSSQIRPKCPAQMASLILAWARAAALGGAEVEAVAVSDSLIPR